MFDLIKMIKFVKCKFNIYFYLHFLFDLMKSDFVKITYSYLIRMKTDGQLTSFQAKIT